MQEINADIDHKPRISEAELYDALDKEWDFEKFLEPYQQAGTETGRVRRTWGTVCDYLINKRGYPPEAVGAAIFQVWLRIKREGHFTGNDTYGSKGRAFITALRRACDDLIGDQAAIVALKYTQVFVENKIFDELRMASVTFENMPFWVNWTCKKYWQWREWDHKKTGAFDQLRYNLIMAVKVAIPVIILILTLMVAN